MEENNSTPLESLLNSSAARDLTIGVVGMGYVGLPLAVEFARVGYKVLGFDINADVVAGLIEGTSHVQDVASADVAPLVDAGSLAGTTDLSRLAECDVISICVPTPLNKLKDPDLSYVVAATQAIRDGLRRGQLVVLESTTYPGTTREVVLPILEESGLLIGEDIFLCYSPERVDPGNATWHTKNTPKVLGGASEQCTRVGAAIYATVFDSVVPVTSLEAAELTKVYENAFRLINIALANELAQACDKLDVDVWEVIDAAATKPFGFMKFTPGPGLGGHCIPLDPHYLSWKMRSLAYKTRMIDLASEINAEMPAFVVRKVADALNEEGKALNGSRVLIIGVAYKPNVDDLRESPALEIINLLRAKGTDVAYHDPYCPVLDDDGYTSAPGSPLESVSLTETELETYDAVVIVTHHANIDYALIAEHAPVIVDSRGVMRSFSRSEHIVGLSGKG